jgi:hypothetical protein
LNTFLSVVYTKRTVYSLPYSFDAFSWMLLLIVHSSEGRETTSSSLNWKKNIFVTYWFSKLIWKRNRHSWIFREQNFGCKVVSNSKSNWKAKFLKCSIGLCYCMSVRSFNYLFKSDLYTINEFSKHWIHT